MKDVYDIFIKVTYGNTPLMRAIYKTHDNIKIDLKWLNYEGVDSDQLDQDRTL
jgi:hypothetical protein